MTVNDPPSINRFVILCAVLAAMAGLLFGFDTGNIAGALLFIKHDFHTSTLQNSLIVSITVLGAFLGAIFSGKLTQQFGRRTMLIFSAILFIFGACLGALSIDIGFLIIARMILGLAIGISSYTAPLYISEIAPAKNRGALVLLNGIAITSGEAIAFLSDYYLSNYQNWRMMILMGVIPAIILLIGMLKMPDSPRWLLSKAKNTMAIEILRKIRGVQNVTEELKEILSVLSMPKFNYRSLFVKKLKPALIVGIGLGIFQQFFGINTVMYYGPFIFQHAGFHTTGSQIMATFFMGVVNVIMTIITGLMVDRLGRRKLLIGGSLLAGVSLMVMAGLFNKGIVLAWQSDLLLLFMMLYIAGYCISVGSLFWLVISEIFPLHVRGLAMSLATAIQWLANFVVSITFLSMLNQLGSSVTFYCFATVCFLAILFTYRFIPETKGKTLEQIELSWKHGTPVMTESS